MINLTLDQAKLALDIIENDIYASEASAEYEPPSYNCVETMRYNLNRAVLAERLQNAINASKEG